MGRAYDPARAMRERLKSLEARERARTEARAVAEGVEETVELGRERGAEFDKTPLDKSSPRRGERQTPYRRQAGLEWLERKGRISARQRASGEAYGACYRRAGDAAGLGSSWEVQPGGGGPAAGPSLGMILKQAAGRERAEAELAAMRDQLFGQSDLVSVCDLVCGQEMTPREAGGDREAPRIEAVLKVALDLLARR